MSGSGIRFKRCFIHQKRVIRPQELNGASGRSLRDSGLIIGKRELMRNCLRLFFLSMGFIFVLGCSPLISQFDATAYRDATSLKVDSLVIMNKATTSYKLHSQEVEMLKIKLDKAYEYAKGIPHNEITAQMWKKMIDPGQALLGGFLQRWEEKETFSSFYVREEKKMISHAFDDIICLEANKKKITNCDH